MRLPVMFSCVLSLAFSSLACGSSKEEVPVGTVADGGQRRGTDSNTPPAPTATQVPVDGLAVVERGGELFFVLEESSEAFAKVEKDCRATKDPAGCVERIREGGSHESLRIGKTAEGLQIESVGHHDEKEEVYTKLGFSARRGPGAQVLCSATTAITGTRVGRPAHWQSFTLVVMDEHTIALASDADGPMVYRRRK